MCFNVLEFDLAQTLNFLKEIWMMVACLTGWHIWTKRWKFIFQQHKLPSGEVLLNIWFQLVSWLRGRYDLIKGGGQIIIRA